MKKYYFGVDLKRCYDEVGKELSRRGYEVYRSFYVVEPVYIISHCSKDDKKLNLNEIVSFFGENYVYDLVKIIDDEYVDRIAIEVYFPKMRRFL